MMVFSARPFSAPGTREKPIHRLVHRQIPRSWVFGSWESLISSTNSARRAAAAALVLAETVRVSDRGRPSSHGRWSPGVPTSRAERGASSPSLAALARLGGLASSAHPPTEMLDANAGRIRWASDDRSFGRERHRGPAPTQRDARSSRRCPTLIRPVPRVGLTLPSQRWCSPVRSTCRSKRVARSSTGRPMELSVSVWCIERCIWV